MAVSVSLGPRLGQVAAFVPEGSRLGDIGTDHAYLPIFLWESGKIIKAVAVEVHEGPYRSACSAVTSRGLQDYIHIRFGDGLKPVQAGEVDVLTIAGMGGNTMLEILTAKPEVVKQVNDLVLQPQGAEGKVRLSLLSEGWLLKEEKYITEEGRIYIVMHYSREKGYTLEQLQAIVDKWQDKVLINWPILGTEDQAYKSQIVLDSNDFESDEEKNIGEGITEEQNVEKENIGKEDIGKENTGKEDIGKEKTEKENKEKENIKSVIERWIWELGPLAMDNPSPELKVLLREQVKTLNRTIGQMQKSTQEKVIKRISEYELTIKVLEGLEKCLFPLV